MFLLVPCFFPCFALLNLTKNLYGFWVTFDKSEHVIVAATLNNFAALPANYNFLSGAQQSFKFFLGQADLLPNFGNSIGGEEPVLLANFVLDSSLVRLHLFRGEEPLIAAFAAVELAFPQSCLSMSVHE